MRYPTTDQSAGHRAQKGALDFGLTKRALKFARLYAENNWTITRAAQEAGFSDRGRGAHVRGSVMSLRPRSLPAGFIAPCRAALRNRTEENDYAMAVAPSSQLLRRLIEPVHHPRHLHCAPH
jgi:hypothetical protein